MTSGQVPRTSTAPLVTSDSPRGAKSLAVASVLIVMLLGACLALALGQDGNGDQHETHAYAAWLLFHPHQDVAYHASLIPGAWNAPWYLLALHAPLWVTVSYLGALHGLAIWLAGAVAWRALEPTRAAWRLSLALVAGLMAIAGAATLTEFGTTFGDLPTSIPILLAVWLFLGASPEEGASRRGRLLVVGLLLGMSFGLKLTNGVYVLGFVGAMAVTNVRTKRSRHNGRDIALLAAGGLIGSAMTGGYLWVRYWSRFQNPTFPLLNQVFASPFAERTSARDERFLPDGLWEMLTLPWRMATVSGYPSERDGRDVRWAIIASLIVVLLLLLALSRRRSRPPAQSSQRFVQSGAENFLFAFCGVSWIAWMMTFGVARYMITIELLSGTVLILLVARLARTPSRTLLGSLVALSLMVGMLVVPFFLYNSRPGSTWYGFQRPAIAELSGTMVVFPTTRDLSYLLLAFPDDAQSMSLVDFRHRPTSDVWANHVRTALSRHQGPVVSLVRRKDLASSAAIALEFGFVLDRDSCHTLRSSFSDVPACRWLPQESSAKVRPE